MHGLGIVTSFDEYLDQSTTQAIKESDPKYAMTPNAKLLSPSPNSLLFKRNNEFIGKNSIRSTSVFQFLNVYDSFLVDDRTNTKIYDLFMDEFHSSSYPLSQKTLYYANTLYQASTLRYALKFDTGSEQFPIDTSFKDFNAGSTMSHIDPGLGNGALDELMWAIAEHSKTTDLEGSHLSPLGYYQLRMLQTIGYELKIDPDTIPRAMSASVSTSISLQTACIYFVLSLL